jgi:hypothetical protein
MSFKPRKVNPGEETRTLIRVDEALKTIALFGAVIVGSYAVISGIYNIGYSSGQTEERTVGIAAELKWRYYNSGFAAGKAWKEAGEDKVSVNAGSGSGSTSNIIQLPAGSGMGYCTYQNSGSYNCASQ